MADVRLTAVNPEDSQVYPVACNDKGELLLESTDGNFDVPGDLTVDGSATFANSVDGYYFRANEPNPEGGPSAAFLGQLNGTETSRIRADGSATFAGKIYPQSGSFNFRQGKVGQVLAVYEGAEGDSAATAVISNDGSATFAGNIALGGVENNSIALRRDVGSIRVSSSNVSQSVFAAQYNTNTNATILADGSATFAGNVTAPNINFKLAPDYVTTLPAPLIDEGFVANDSIDLLTELIKMKIQIRDLNAFMERSLQENPET